MKKIKRWALLFAAMGSTVYGVSCSTAVRDAVQAGALDFVTGTTTDTLSGAITPEPDPDPLQIELVDGEE